MEGNFFVTPHAVRRFISRISPGMSYEQARDAIIDGVDRTDSPLVRTRNGVAYVLRVRRPYSFRAVIGPGERGAPAIITILRSGN